MKRTLKFLEEKPFYMGTVVILVFYFIFYTIPNRIPTLYEPFEFGLLEFEQQLPVIPWTNIIYLSLLPFLLVAAYFLPKKIYAASVVLVALMLVFHGLIFFFFPTIYPREYYVEENGFFTWVQTTVIPFIDEPRNCFPSLHVSAPFMFSFVWLKYRTKIGILFLLWAIAIAISTLTTKQHYMWDVAGGVAVAFIAVYAPIFPRTTAKKS